MADFHGPAPERSQFVRLCYKNWPFVSSGRRDALKMVQRRAKAAGIRTKIGNHTFRATGITIYLTNGGDLEKAQQMAAHESPRTTKLYDRRNDVVSLDEVEKVVF